MKRISKSNEMKQQSSRVERRGWGGGRKATEA
jgi:hypothetical protein